MKKNTSRIMPVLKRLLKYSKTHMGLIVLVALFALSGNVFSVISPTIIGNIIDKMVGVSNVDFAYIKRTLLLLAVIYFISSLSVWLSTSLGTKVAYKIVQQIRKEAFDNLTKLKIRVIDDMSVGNIMSRFSTDADMLIEALTQIFNLIFAAAVIVFASLGIMLYLSPLVTLAVVITTPLVFIVSRFVATRSSAFLKDQQKTMGELSGLAQEYIKGLRVIKIFDFEKAAQEKFEKVTDKLAEVGQRAQFMSSLVNPTTRIVNYIGYVLVGLVGGLSAIYLRFSVGDIAAFLTYSTLFSRPFNEFSAVTSQILGGLAGADRIFEIIDMPPEKPDDLDATQINHASGEIIFDNVNFSYDLSRPLIKDLSFEAGVGKKVAIVGPTGAGKTTLINLLMRFYETDSGKITLDGQDITTITKDSYRRSFGLVLQETQLFNATVAQNIAYGRPNASMEEIIDAAKRANAHPFILTLPNGYDTIIDESGENISAGQKQLITIARAMLLEPPLLILDEATSSVDALTEQKIQATFAKMTKGRTSFVIAHRLSTIKDADIILVMDKGSVIEKGTHEELIKMGGFYYRLYNSQFGAALESTST